MRHGVRQSDGVQQHRSQNGQNSGFTLIELLVAIGIIGVLAGLLLAGIQSAMSSVSTAKAANELRNLETALAAFHAEFGQYPPSEIVLHETASGWSKSSSDPFFEETVRSLAIIRQLWPNFTPSDVDINGDGSQRDADNPLELNGAECLAFFLGGVVKDGNLVGFSKNLAQPFSLTGSNRLGPFHEFDPSRFVDKDGDGMPEYLDTYSGQQNPILYFSSYDGRGYRVSEVTPFLVNGVYRQGAETYPRMWESGDPAIEQDDKPAWKAKTFQLISPGVDGLYGVGGEYDPDNTGQLSQEDRDNLTNFVSGKLN